MYSVYNIDDSKYNFEKDYKRALIASIKLLGEKEGDINDNNDSIIFLTKKLKLLNVDLVKLEALSTTRFNNLQFLSEEILIQFIQLLKKILNILENDILLESKKLLENINVSKEIWDNFNREIDKFYNSIEILKEVIYNKYKRGIIVPRNLQGLNINDVKELIEKFFKVINDDIYPLIEQIYSNYNQTVEGDRLLGNGLYGDGLYVNDFKYFLNQSYEKKRDQIYKDWVYLPQYSDLRTAIYKNKNTNEIVVSNRGTYDLKDVGTDIKAFLDNKDNRLKSYKNLISRIKNDYPNSYIISIGHSLGGLVARQDPSVDEILTFNKPTMLREMFRKQPKNQYEVRSTNDPVSILSKYKLYRRNRGNNITFDSQTNNPLKAHSLSSLDNLPDTEYIGNPNK